MAEEKSHFLGLDSYTGVDKIIASTFFSIYIYTTSISRTIHYDLHDSGSVFIMHAIFLLLTNFH